MKNDLTPFEKNLLKCINLNNNTKFTHKNLMEWCTDRELLQKSLQEREEIFEALDVYVAIKR